MSIYFQTILILWITMTSMVFVYGVIQYKKRKLPMYRKDEPIHFHEIMVLLAVWPIIPLVVYMHSKEHYYTDAYLYVITAFDFAILIITILGIVNLF